MRYHNASAHAWRACNRSLWTVLIFLLPVFIVYAEYKPTCAVLTFDPRGGVSVDEVSLLSDRFSIELNNLGKYTLISRGKMKEILMIQEFSREDHCSVSECAVEAGQMLGVQYMIYGSLGKIGSLFTMNTYLVNVQTRATEKTATTDHRGKIEEMLTQVMKANVFTLLGVSTDPRKTLSDQRKQQVQVNKKTWQRESEKQEDTHGNLAPEPDRRGTVKQEKSKFKPYRRPRVH